MNHLTYDEQERVARLLAMPLHERARMSWMWIKQDAISFAAYRRMLELTSKDVEGQPSGDRVAVKQRHDMLY